MCRATHTDGGGSGGAGLLADNNRLGEFAGISDTFDEIMAAERGEVIATITTAHVRTSTQRHLPRRMPVKIIQHQAW